LTAIFGPLRCVHGRDASTCLPCGLSDQTAAFHAQAQASRAQAEAHHRQQMQVQADTAAASRDAIRGQMQHAQRLHEEHQAAENRRAQDQRDWERAQERRRQRHERQWLEFRQERLASLKAAGLAADEGDLRLEFGLLQEQREQEHARQVAHLQTQFTAMITALTDQVQAASREVEADAAALAERRRFVLSPRWLRIAAPLAVVTLVCWQMIGAGPALLSLLIAGGYAATLVQGRKRTSPGQALTGKDFALTASGAMPLLAAVTGVLTLGAAGTGILTALFWAAAAVGAGVKTWPMREQYAGLAAEQAEIDVRRQQVNDEWQQVQALDFQQMLAENGIEVDA
jgi:hypothetical protein